MPTLPAFRSHSLDDPMSRRVIAALDAVGAGRSTVILPAPSREFRADLRAQLVAVAPRLVAEGVHAGTEAPPRRATAAPSAAGARSTDPAKAATTARRPVRTRPMTVLVAGTAVVVLGMGGATWFARGALPGDALYGLKRTAEGVDISLSGSDLDKGHALLVDASTRVQEVNDLLSRPQSMAFGTGPSASGAISDDTVTLIVSTLQAADTDTHKGVTTIGDDALTRGDTAGLELVVGWAQGQRDGIDALVNRIPESAAKTQAQTSAAEIRTGLTRATQLLAQVQAGVTCADPGRDEFGPKPCGATASAPATSAPTAPATGGGTGSGATGSTGSGGGSTPVTTPPAGTPSATPAGTPPTSTTSAAAAAPGTSGPVVSVPVAVGSCGVQVSLPVAGVSLGTCPPSP